MNEPTNNSSDLSADVGSDVIKSCLVDLVQVLRKLHHGRMPRELEIAYHRALNIVGNKEPQIPSDTDLLNMLIAQRANINYKDGVYSIWYNENLEAHPLSDLSIEFTDARSALTNTWLSLRA